MKKMTGCMQVSENYFFSGSYIVFRVQAGKNVATGYCEKGLQQTYWPSEKAGK